MAKRKEKPPFGTVMLYKLGGAEKYHGIECTSDVFDHEDDYNEALESGWFHSPQEAKKADDDAKAEEAKKAEAAKAAQAKKPAAKKAEPKSALGGQAKKADDEKPKRAHNEDGTFKADDPETPKNEAFE